jgi:hypothetical protein
MNSYQMVLHRPVETAHDCGNLPRQRTLRGEVTGNAVFREPPELLAPSGRLFGHVAKVLLSEGIGDYALVDEVTPAGGIV